MKKVYLAGLVGLLMLGACNGEEDSTANNDSTQTEVGERDALNEMLESENDIKAASVRFGEGGAENGEQYFSGILAAVLEVDMRLIEITKLDQIDASENKINSTLDSTIAKINRGRNAINLYTEEEWPLRAEFHTITEKWFDAVEGLVNNYLRDLAGPMAKPDDEWTQEELDLYNKYKAAYDEYLAIDSRWVEFQYTYAEANEFIIEGTVDEESMVNQNLSE